MTWAEVMDHPSLQGLPFKIELNKWGKIEMSPIGAERERYQAEIERLLQRLKPGGISSTDVGVKTSENVKVPDVVWSCQILPRTGFNARLWPLTPDICVEIVSPNNLLAEKMHKGSLYLGAGAQEFWLCDATGKMQFFEMNGPLEHSQVCPEFPKQVAPIKQVSNPA